jgi:NAD(P)-dependent dehydrogenase (short-subunit alcohol dehydrogenase family)
LVKRKLEGRDQLEMNGGRQLLLVTGIAEGVGASIAATFAHAGYDVMGIARSEKAAGPIGTLVSANGGTYTHACGDLTRPGAVAAALESYLGRIRIVVHNAHALLIKPFDQTTEAEFERVWRVTCLGAMTVARLVLPHMIAAGEGVIILTGATAGMRGNARFAAFASAKFALRGLAQSLAREYGPLGIHVAHVVLDGLIDAPQTEQRFGSAQAERMEPEAIARTYLSLAGQDRSCWTHELDLRPYSERF